MSTKMAAVASIDSLLRQIAANEKRADANTEAGGYVGDSSHPSTKVEDGTEKATEGERAKENTKDVKEDQGAPSVENASDSTPGGQDSVQLNIGTQQSATGEDSSVETESAKAGKDDPGSSHPARTDNDALEGGKYASQILRLTKRAEELGTALLATIADEANGEVRSKAASRLGKSAAVEQAAAAAAGKAAAGVMDGHDKQAEAQEVVDALAATIDDAFQMAIKTASFLNEYVKAAEEGDDDDKDKGDENPREGSDGDSDGAPSDAADEAAGADDDSDAGSEPDGDGDDAAILQALAGGQDMGGDQAMAGMAAPPDALGAGPDAGGGAPPAGGPPMGGPGPEAGAGGPPMGDPAAGGLPPEAAGPGAAPGGSGEAQAGPGGEIDPQVLLAVLQQLGISPEELSAMAVQKQAELLMQKKASPSKSNWKPKTAEQLRQYKATLAHVRELMGN